MEPNIPTTSEVLALRKLGSSVDQRFVLWAISRLESGDDTLSLTILAGEQQPFNQFEMGALVDKVFIELRLPQYNNKEEAAMALITVRAQQFLNDEISISAVLSEGMGLCVTLDYLESLNDFYLLHFARDDLQVEDYQHYWPDANKGNIDKIVEDYCRNWVLVNEKRH